MREENHKKLNPQIFEGLQNYKEIKEIYKGSTGFISLVECLSGENKGKQYALKRLSKIALDYKDVDKEINLLKLFNDPTIIRYYDSFQTKEAISIIMEFADGGDLYQKIRTYQDNKKKFEKEIALEWISQITLALMTMESKKIYYNISPKKILLATMKGQEVAKLGGFPVIEDPQINLELHKDLNDYYYMSPEVARGERYSNKSQTWALGCLLYELTTFRKPFDSETSLGLMDMIKDKDFFTLPNDTDIEIKNLIQNLLNKDPLKRPSIWEFSKLPEISTRLNAFVEFHKLHDAVAPVFLYRQGVQAKSNIPEKEEKKRSETEK